MRRFVVYATYAVAEIAWSALCLYLLAGFRTDPVVFFETILAWLTMSILAGHWANSFLQESRVYGRFDSKIETWNKMQRELREEERRRQRYGA